METSSRMFRGSDRSVWGRDAKKAFFILQQYRRGRVKCRLSSPEEEFYVLRGLSQAIRIYKLNMVERCFGFVLAFQRNPMLCSEKIARGFAVWVNSKGSYCLSLDGIRIIKANRRQSTKGKTLGFGGCWKFKRRHFIVAIIASWAKDGLGR